MHPYLLTRKQVKARRQACPVHPYRLLLALDGTRLNREILALALDHCSALSQRIDVLVTTPDHASAAMLREFLNRQAEQNIEIRLTITEDDLANQVDQYMRRFPGIKTVVTDDLDGWLGQLGPTMERLRRDGYRFICLSHALKPAAHALAAVPAVAPAETAHVRAHTLGLPNSTLIRHAHA